MKVFNKILLAIGVCFLLLFSTLNANEEIFRAMQDEMDRSLKELRIEGLQPPYYIEYKLTFNNHYSCQAVLGSLVNEEKTNNVLLTVGVRVGSYQFDNSNYIDIGFSFFGSTDDEETFRGRLIPFQLDYKALRRELWLATDAGYKRAAETYSKKEASLKNKIIKEVIPDFIKMEAEELVDTFFIQYNNYEEYKNLVREISAVFKNYKSIDNSLVSFEILPTTIFYLNSEGRRYIKTTLFTGIEIVAQTQADDGMSLVNTYTAYAIMPKDLPKRDSLLNAGKMLADKLSQLAKAEVLDDAYTGPILFEGQAAAEIFAQVFASNLATIREAITDGGFQDNERYSAFQTKIGGRVLPEFLSVRAVPSKKYYMGAPLVGYYKVDDDGVRAQDVLLVDKGYLKNLLSSRVPTKRVTSSNGHQRGGSAMLSNIEVTSIPQKRKDRKQLKQEMIKLCKARDLPYGIIVSKVLDQNIMYTTLYQLVGSDYPFPRSATSIPVLEAYKIYPDGREELIRGVEAKGFTVQSFKDIIYVGKNDYVLNYLAPSISSSFLTGGTPYLPVSIIIPDLLFEDGEIKPIKEDFKKPPFYSKP